MTVIRVGLVTLMLMGCAAETDLPLTAAGSSAALTADTPARTWARAPLMPAYALPVMATVNNKLTLFGNSDELARSGSLETWEWYGGAWWPKPVAAAPSARLLPGVARFGDTIAMFGGLTWRDYDHGALFGETWLWRGCRWEQLAPTQWTPDGRFQPSIATFGKTLLMFGGQSQDHALSDTWVFNYANWTQQPALGPEGCVSPIAVLGSKAIMFCSATDPDDHAGHTWEWDGASWTEKQPATRPSNRYSHQLASYDDRIVMYGGYADSGNWQETWEWDGTDWRDRSVQPSPPPRDNYQLAQQGAELVLFGGGEGNTWTWDGEQWSIAAKASTPPQRHDYTIATLGERAILFGGCCKSGGGAGPSDYCDDTWAWDGRSWKELSFDHRPPPRAAGGLAAVGGKLVLFGGAGADGPLSDTWELDGTTWTERRPATVPPARQLHAMSGWNGKAYVLGGVSSLSVRDDRALADFWAWDGSDWREIPLDARPGSTPAGGYRIAMAGYGDHLALFEPSITRLWLWDGNAWSVGSDDWNGEAIMGPQTYMAELPLGAAGSHLVVSGTDYISTYSVEWDGTSWSSTNYFAQQALAPMTAQGHTLVSLADWPLRTWTYAGR